MTRPCQNAAASRGWLPVTNPLARKADVLEADTAFILKSCQVLQAAGARVRLRVEDGGIVVDRGPAPGEVELVCRRCRTRFLSQVGRPAVCIGCGSSRHLREA